MNDALFKNFLSDYYSKVCSGEDWERAGAKVCRWYIVETIVVIANVLCFSLLLFSPETWRIYLQWIFWILLIGMLAIYVIVLLLDRIANRNASKKTRCTLAKQLMRRKWNNEAMIGWLILNCKKGKQREPVGIRAIRELKGFFVIAILPIITLCSTVIAEELDIQSLLLSALIVIMIFVVLYAVKLAIEVPLFHKRRCQNEFLDKMEQDLEYMLARLKATGKMPCAVNCAKKIRLSCGEDSTTIVCRRKV